MAYFYRPFFFIYMPVKFTVSQINNNIDNLIKQRFSNIIIEGEISSFNISPSGHSYFTLKDEKSEISCVIFKGDFLKLNKSFKVGDYIHCIGSLGLYTPKGQFQFRVLNIKSDGLGIFWENFQKLKLKLSKEGLFDDIHKSTIPKYIKKICIITSLNGVVKDDLIKIIRSRATYQNIKIFPITVQGIRAANSISQSIKHINKYYNFDVLIIARGGGSIEDLWPFNEEIVARSIFESRIPIISAIGHETDYTIADFVSDKRASTPSEAAEIVSINQQEALIYLDELFSRMDLSINNIFDKNRTILEDLSNRKVITDPDESIFILREKIHELYKYLNVYLESKINKIESSLNLFEATLNGLNPYNVLNRGYSFLLNNKNQNISSINDVNTGDKIYSLHSDGKLKLEVYGKRKKDK